MPLANVVYARTFALREQYTHTPGDAYFYHHTGTDKLRCLAAASTEGGRGHTRVYEGDVTVVDGDAIQLDLKGYEGTRVVPYVMRLDFEKDGKLHQRVWSPDGSQPHARYPPHCFRDEQEHHGRFSRRVRTTTGLEVG